VHTHGERTAYAPGASEFTRGFGGVRDGQSLAYRVVCYISSFVRQFFKHLGHLKDLEISKYKRESKVRMAIKKIVLFL
jgi:hypothetical protein